MPLDVAGLREKIPGMETITSLLNQPEFVHVAINHFPIVGLAVAAVSLLIAVIARNRGGTLIGLALVAVLALSVWPVSEFGEEGADRVIAMADNDGQAYLHYHEALAERWSFLFYVTAGIAALGFGLNWKWPKTLNPISIAALVLALASLTAGLFIAHTGGEIRHREFRRGTPPAAQTDTESR